MAVETRTDKNQVWLKLFDHRLGQPFEGIDVFIVTDSLARVRDS